MCKPSPMKLLNFDTVNSTMDTAVRLIQEGLDEPFIVRAKQQSKGRGRRENKWFSPLNGLYLTFAFPFREAIPIDHVLMYHYSTAIAICSALRKTYNLNATVKWPNDILIETKKAGGVLIEYISNGEDFLLLGIGLNVNNNVQTFPKDLQDNSISLKTILRKSLDMNKLTRSLEEEIIFSNSLVANNKNNRIAKQYNELNTYNSKQLILIDGSKFICKGIDTVGNLILENSLETKLLSITDSDRIKEVNKDFSISKLTFKNA